MSEEERFKRFIEGLEELSEKYGVAIRCCGGVQFTDFQHIEYSRDHTSGDIDQII